MGEERFEVQALRWASRTPDEKHMVFQALGRIWVRNLETGAQERLTKQEDHYEFYPVISPVGDHVLYTTWNASMAGARGH
jgi:Tol biopolymer transport system component